jgi:hypothetical protein
VTAGRSAWRLLALGVVVWFAMTGRAEAQLGSLVSPGPLAKAHAALEGADNCQKCHERGRRVTPEKCLTCHAPIAKRMQEKKGVHRAVTECVTCHVDHAGVDGQLRPFDTAAFNHAAVTGFALDRKHAAVAAKCEACHKLRSFLTASAACGSCHADVHKGSLGAACEKCHSTSVAFKDARSSFDHGLTAFPLAGAHKTIDCAKCHAAGGFKVAKFGACLDCHRTPHPATVSSVCTSCHTNDNWKTKKFDHSRTAFPLVGRHAAVDCDGCHKAPATKVKPASATCAACHADAHKGEFKQDCKACHAETGFAGAAFDHERATTSHFALADGHARIACRACHKTISAAAVPLAQKAVDFRGLVSGTACASCHADAHAGELGAACESCHSPKTFRVTSFTHPKMPELFAGRHAPLACDACHKPAGPGAAMPAAAAGPGGKVLAVKFKATPTACASCHADPHLGQVGADCATCHSVEGAKFAPDLFAHTRSRFVLVGKHQTVECAKCHRSETGTFPAGPGTAVRLKALATDCRSCHADVHLGQVGAACETCHTAETFEVTKYQHRRPAANFFGGGHQKAKCGACHKSVTGAFPAGPGTAVRLSGLATTCQSCHADVHLGQVGTSCETCHTVDAFRVLKYQHRRPPPDFFVGSHLRARCDACHKPVTAQFPAGRGTAVQFTLETRCVACHVDVHHGALGEDCQRCHRPAPLAVR